MIVILGILCFVGVVAALVNPFGGLLAMLAMAIIQPGELYPIFTMLHVERIMAILVMGSYLLRQQRLEVPKISKTVLAFWGAMFLTVPLAYWISHSLEFTIDFGRVVIYHLLIVNLVNTPRRFRIFVLTFVVLTAWLAGSSMWAFNHGMYQSKDFGERAEGLTSSGGDPNTLALTMVYSLPMVFLGFAEGASLWTIMALITTVVSIAILVLTGSRTGFISLCALGLLYSVRRKGWPVFLLMAALCIALLWAVIPQNYKDRYKSVSDRDKDESYQSRLLSWEGGWRMFLHNPLTGVGVGNYTDANGGRYWPGPGRKHWLNAHSLYFKVLGEMGLLGIVTFGWFVYTSLSYAQRLRKQLLKFPDWPGEVRHFPQAAWITLVLLLFAGYSSHNLYRQTWFMLAALLGSIELMIAKAGTATKGSKAGQARLPLTEPVTAPAPASTALHRLNLRPEKS